MMGFDINDYRTLYVTLTITVPRGADREEMAELLFEACSNLEDIEPIFSIDGWDEVREAR